jgi:hypothetical protein
MCSHLGHHHGTILAAALLLNNELTDLRFPEYLSR